MPSSEPRTQPLQQTGLAIITGLPLLAACFVAVRIYARKRLRLPLDWGEYLASQLQYWNSFNRDPSG